MRLDYLKLVLKHKWYVFLVGCKLKVPFWQILTHDISKLGPAEYKHYQRWFFKDKNDPEGFAAAWLHHQNHNLHHWDYWLSRTKRVEQARVMSVEPVPMPERYVREMVADWDSAGKAYKNCLPLQDWLNKEWENLVLHEKTIDRLRAVLAECGMYWPGDLEK